MTVCKQSIRYKNYIMCKILLQVLLNKSLHFEQKNSKNLSIFSNRKKTFAFFGVVEYLNIVYNENKKEI